MAKIYWVNAPNGRVAVLERPRGGDWLQEEVEVWKDQGLDLVVSLLTEDEETDLGLREEKGAVESAGMLFFSYPIPDGGAPDSKAGARELIRHLAEYLKSGASIGVHCRAGIGRSPMIAAAVLVASGVPLGEAIGALSQARGLPVPETEEQLGWLKDFAALS